MGQPARRIVVTGGSSGIGLALCRQLVVDRGCHVYLGSRSEERGAVAVAAILEAAPADAAARLELLRIDTTSDESVGAAAAIVAASLGGATLYALVNNAGCGLAHGVAGEVVLDTNLHGAKRVVDAFAPLLQSDGARIVNVGSGAGPMYIATVPNKAKKMLCSADVTWAEIDRHARERMEKASFAADRGARGPYGLSKVRTCPPDAPRRSFAC